MRLLGLPRGKRNNYGITFFIAFSFALPLCAQKQLLQPKASKPLQQLVGTFIQNRDTIRLLNGQWSKTNHIAEKAIAGTAQQNGSKVTPKKYKTNNLGGAITLSISTANTTCESNNGSIIVMPSGGTPPYQFSINNYPYQSNGGFLYLPAGTYPISVTDAGGDTVNTQVTITNSLPRPQGKVVNFNYPSNCGASDGSVTVEPTVGTPPFTYSLDLQTFQTIPTFTNLAQSWYTYYLKDANGCEGSIDFVAMYNRNCTGGSFGFSTTGSSCGKGGIVEFIGGLNNDFRPFLFSLDGVHYQQDSVFNNLPTGISKVYIKDVNGSVTVYAFQILDQCFLYVTATPTDAICNGRKGSLLVSAQNGNPPYQYSIDGTNFQSSNEFNNLTPGIYTVIVKDSKNGLGSTSSIIVYGACLTLTAQSTNVSCNNNNGTITIHAAGGKPPYQYSVDGTTFQIDGVFTSVNVGNHVAIVTDENGSRDSVPVVVNATSGPAIQLVATMSASCIGTDGIVTINAIGGTQPLSYSLDGIGYQPSNVISNLAGDKTYNAWVKDAQGCVVESNNVTVKLNCLRAVASSAPANCGQKTGSITVTIQHGTSPYQYSVDGVHFQDQSTFLNLAKGSYSVTVKDSAGLVISLPVTVSEICLVLQTNISNTTCGNNNGSLAITASNGTAPYEYSIDGNHFQNSNTFANLAANQYSITVKDATGNAQAITATIGSIPLPSIEATATTVSCSNNDGTITAVASGGTLPYQFSIDGNNYQTSISFVNLGTGNYKVEVKDANGCLSSQMITVPVKNTLQVHAAVDTTICEGSNVKLGATSTATSFQWMPSDGLNNTGVQDPIASPIVTTKYFVTASTSVCTMTDSVMIIVHPAPISDAGTDVSVCYGKAVQLNGSGGMVYHWQPSTYLSDASIANPIAICPPGIYTYYLNVTDANGCASLQSSTVKVNITPAAKVFAGNDTSVMSNEPFQLKAIDVNSSGFVSYRWTPIDGLTNPNISNPVALITKDTHYSVTASTVDSCVGTADIFLKAYVGPDIYVPSAFTPNGDGRNDVIKVFPIGITSFRFFVIYDRFGRQVFYTNQPLNGWDGKTSGIIQTTGTYVWMACGVSSNNRVIERKGTLTLVR